MSRNISVYSIDAKLKNVYKFDAALALTGFGRYNYLITLLCGSIALGSMLETMGFGFIVPASQCDLNLTLEQKGWLSAIPYIGLVCASQAWGYLADTRGRRKILMFSMFLGVICSMLSSLSPNLIVFATLRLLAAALMAASNAIVHAYFGELTPKTHSDVMISVLSSIFLFSTIVATGVAWGVLTLNFNIPLDLLGLNYRPWRLLILCFAFPFLISSIALLKAPESPKYLMSQGKNEEVLRMLQQMYVTNTGKDISSFPVHAVILDDQDSNMRTTKKQSFFEIIINQTVPIFKPPLLKYTAMLMCISFAIYGCGNGTFMWLPDIMDRFYVAVDNNAANGKTFCQMLSVRSHLFHAKSSNIKNKTVCDDSFRVSSYPTILIFTSILTLCNITIAILLRWVPKKILLLVFLGLGSSSLILIYFVPNLYVSWVLFIIFFSTSTLVGILSAFAVELFPTQFRAMAVSTILIFGRVGSIVGTNIMGLLLEKNCDLNFFLFSAVLFAGCVSGFFLHAKKK